MLGSDPPGPPISVTKQPRPPPGQVPAPQSRRRGLCDPAGVGQRISNAPATGPTDSQPLASREAAALRPLPAALTPSRATPGPRGRIRGSGTAGTDPGLPHHPRRPTPWGLRLPAPEAPGNLRRGRRGARGPLSRGDPPAAGEPPFPGSRSAAPASLLRDQRSQLRLCGCRRPRCC